MDIRTVPASVLLVMMLLSINAFFGMINATAVFGDWHARGIFPIPFERAFFAIVFSLVPTLAMIEIFKARISGRYLGILTLMMVCGKVSRVIVDQAAYPAHPADKFAMLFPTLGVLGGTAFLIYAFAFSKDANAYFGIEPN